MSSAAGSGGSTDRPTDAGEDNPEEEGPSHGAAVASASVELPRKRKGEVDLRSEPRDSDDFLMDEDLSRSEGEDQQVKMKCFREPHRQIEKRRRDKMNNLIDELSAMIPSCQPQPRKLDKLTVLRKAVQHLKELRAGSSSAFSESTTKPSILPHEDLRHLLLRAADGFLLVVTCDRAKILFISESVSQVLNFSRLELMGQSLFDFIHHKDIHKVKEQLASSNSFPRQSLVDAATPVPPQPQAHPHASHMSTGSRRSFFCRMKHSRVTAKQDDNSLLPTSSKKKDSYKYCTLHCTGYMGSWPSSDLDSEPDLEPFPLYCLVTVCRLHPHSSSQTTKDQVNTKPTEFITRYSIDGKFIFVDQQATTITGYLPQEVLGTSCYEYIHHDDLHHLAEKHREVLRSKEKIETQCYKFKTKYGSYVNLQSQWFSFTNPWTKEIEFIVSLNRVVTARSKDCADKEEAGSSKALPDVSKELPIIPGLSPGVGTMIFAGSIGTQIANELTDSYGINSSPSSGASSPFGLIQEKLVAASPHTSKSGSSQEEAGGSSESKATAGTSSGSSESTGESSLDLDNVVVPGLSSFSSDEAAMAVIMSLLETDANMGQSGEFEDLHWPF
ncbi:basic helix-loop-helix ARNT-like protein 1 isoform X2 [Periophthalmus magnuspinnatus]|uniref:basic helix-loop-helix ARNT-like protein 1 isoform X2 n=1 Tax=Periophthalmus magnuspinnatus TaxID=409849 RepID=UPI0024363B95|nr:basic helix-loop-helix ARNT-like protein 1 isoform X2 [Periophthalmus magnuspinnatus]